MLLKGELLLKTGGHTFTYKLIVKPSDLFDMVYVTPQGLVQEDEITHNPYYNMENGAIERSYNELGLVRKEPFSITITQSQVKVAVSQQLNEKTGKKQTIDQPNVFFFKGLAAFLKKLKIDYVSMQTIDNVFPELIEHFRENVNLSKKVFKKLRFMNYDIDNPQTYANAVALDEGILNYVSYSDDLISIVLDRMSEQEEEGLYNYYGTLDKGYFKGDTKKVINYSISDLIYFKKSTYDLRLSNRGMETDKVGKLKKLLNQHTPKWVDGVDINAFVHTLEDLFNQLHNKGKNFEHLLSKNYYIVTPETKDRVMNYLIEASKTKVVAVDTETTGLRINQMMHIDPSKADRCVGVVMSVEENESFYFPLDHAQHWDLHSSYYEDGVLLENEGEFDPYQERSLNLMYAQASPKRVEHILRDNPTSLQNLYENPQDYFDEYKHFFETARFVVFNAGFDWRVFYGYHVDLNVVCDIFAVYMLTKVQASKEQGIEYKNNTLKDWTYRDLQRHAIELDSVSKIGVWDDKRMAFNFRDLPFEIVRLYVGADSDNTLSLYNKLIHDKVIETYASQELIEIETVFAMEAGYQQFYGHHLPKEDVHKVFGELVEEAKNFEIKMEEEASKFNVSIEGVNLNSVDQLKKLLYVDLKIPVQYDPKDKSKPTTQAKILEELVNNDKDATIEDQDYPFLWLFLKYKKVIKLQSDLKKSMENEEFDGYLYSEVKQFLETGRAAVSKPNYQSYSDKLKHYVKARKGFYILDYDYSSIESRIIASLSQESYLMEAFEDIDIDYHKLQASKLYEVLYEKVDKALRKVAKVLNFAIPYGLSDSSLAYSLYKDNSSPMVLKAKNLKRDYFAIQPKVEKFFTQNRLHGRVKRYTKTLAGRRRYYPKGLPDYKVDLVAGNHPVQGSAADIYKLAAGLIFTEVIRKRKLFGKVLLSAFVHDEMVIEVSEEINPVDFLSWIRPYVELHGVLPTFCPLLMGCGFGTNWYYAKSTEIPVRLQMEMVEDAINHQTNGTPRRFFPNWENETSSTIEELSLAYIHRHELEQVIYHTQLPEVEGKALKSINHDYLNNCMKRAKIKDDTSKPLKEIVEKVFVHYQVPKPWNIQNILRPSEVVHEEVEKELEVTPIDIEIYKSGLLPNLQEGKLNLKITSKTKASVVELIKKYATQEVIKDGLQIRLWAYTTAYNLEEKDVAIRQQEVKLHLLAYYIDKRRLPEFLSNMITIHNEDLYNNMVNSGTKPRLNISNLHLTE